MNVRRTEIHTAEPIVPEPRAFEFQIVIKLKRHKLPGADKIPEELFKVGSRTIRSEIHKLINSVWNKEGLPEKWKESIIVPIYKKGDTPDCSTYRGISLLSVAKMYSVQTAHTRTLYDRSFSSSREIGQEINAVKSKYMVMPRDQNVG